MGLMTHQTAWAWRRAGTRLVTWAQAVVAEILFFQFFDLCIRIHFCQGCAVRRCVKTIADAAPRGWLL